MNEREARRGPAKHGFIEPKGFLGAVDPYNPTSEDHDAHVERVLKVTKGRGFPVLRT